MTEQQVQFADTSEGCINFGYFVYNYSRFHRNYWNRMIHYVFVPLIAWSMGGMIMCKAPFFEFNDVIPIPYAEKIFENPRHLTVHWLIIFAWSGTYCIVDPLIGFLQMAIWTWQAIITQNAFDRGDTYFGLSLFTFCMWVQIISWISQFIGHGVFEGR
jgi:2-hydroxy fatty acid dioxygenase